MTKRAKPGQGKRAAYYAKWYRAHRERVLALHHRYQQEHREERSAYQRKRLGCKPWHKGGPGRPPLSAKGVKSK